MNQENCQLCGEPMPEGEEMFNYHGYSGPCPKPPLPPQKTERENLLEAIEHYRGLHKSCIDATGHPDHLKSMRKDWRCEACKIADVYLTP